jgi:ectoine hydroxylase-related dioxygenase (phytanoyl-CoA dioxygenase family)
VDVHSDLWLDQPDAHEQIDARCRAGTVSQREAELLHGWVDNGFAKMSLPTVTDEFAAAFDDEIEALWESRPTDLAVSQFVGAKKSFRDYDGPVRERGYRIPDLHSHSERALDLYLDPALFRMIELIFGEPAVAFQSIYFEHGSMQGLHRDPLFVATNPPMNWIALEDITDDSGPLMYVPGSHRLPWFEFEPGTIECRNKVTRERREEGNAWFNRMLEERGLQAQAFTCRRGDAFLWHGGLAHGGQAIRNKQRTRKSFVVHYSTAADYKSRTAAMDVRDGDGWRTIARTTDKVIERDGARGLDSPRREPAPRAEPVAAPAPAKPGLLRRWRRTA